MQPTTPAIRRRARRRAARLRAPSRDEDSRVDDAKRSAALHDEGALPRVNGNVHWIDEVFGQELRVEASARPPRENCRRSEAADGNRDTMPDIITCRGGDFGLSTTSVAVLKKLATSIVCRPALSAGSGAEHSTLLSPEGVQVNPSRIRREPSTYAANCSLPMSLALTDV